MVDDEPPAINHISMIIQKKCMDFQVVATAYNGQEALEKLPSCHPDVVLTDISMPVMDGLELAERLKEEEPEAVCVIISGYQEFEYAQQAIRSGVAEYLLKPVMPSALGELFEKIRKQLCFKYYHKRNSMIEDMVKGIEIPEKELDMYFLSDAWYGAIVRLNGLPARFRQRNRAGVFSDVHEMLLTYGRDEWETLYLCPSEIIDRPGFAGMIEKQIQKEQPESAYRTIVIYKNPVQARQIGSMVKRLYRTLDARIIIGTSQTLVLDNDQAPDKLCPDRDYGYLQELEELLNRKKYSAARNMLEHIMAQWQMKGYPQIWVEGRIREAGYMIRRCIQDERNCEECEFLLDETFANAENTEQLIRNITDLFFRDTKDGAVFGKLDTRDYFETISSYIRSHMSEPLSLNQVSHDLGISQTYLNKLLRKYADTSFNSYLTMLRMEKAKRLLGENGEMYVKDVAEQVGYKDQFYFSRIFYSYTGIRPSEYMESAQEKG